MTSFDRNSTDAMFAKILERLEQQDRILQEIRSDQGARLSALEQEKWFQRGIVAAISVVAAGIWQFLTKPR